MSQGNFPLDDLTYDMITLLYEKSKGLQAYDKYLQDAQSSPPCMQLLQQLRQQDEDAEDDRRRPRQHVAGFAPEGGVPAHPAERRRQPAAAPLLDQHQ